VIDYLEYYTIIRKQQTFVRNVIIEGAPHENGGKIWKIWKKILK
jgi:hypothetical protein